MKWVEEKKPQVKSIGILGGSSEEPELLELLRIYPDSAVTYLGIEKGVNENPFIDLDLNELGGVNQSFDIVICAQVLEHIWNLDNCMKNLSKMIDPQHGLLWLNCPASNMVHGSPDYFSAGYSWEMVTKNLENYQFEIILADSIGSRRLYFFTHTLQYWPTKLELAHPLLTYRPLRSYGRRLIPETFLGFFGRLYSLLLSNKKLSKSQYDTETFVLAKKRLL
jgi:2-polyprenyl-3-methyl-5-hydroxy-6-metoxy-1,4-benzoquinol methylase